MSMVGKKNVLKNVTEIAFYSQNMFVFRLAAKHILVSDILRLEDPVLPCVWALAELACCPRLYSLNCFSSSLLS